MGIAGIGASASRYYNTYPIRSSSSFLLKKPKTSATTSHHHYFVMASSSPSVQSGEKLTAPYGSWKSPITADVVSGSDKRLGGSAVDSLGRLFWLESRPTESGYFLLFEFVLSITVTD